MDEDGLIYDWNTAGDFLFPASGKVTLDDETLRDGLQNPSVHDPSIEEKIEILHLMEDLGIEMANIRLPAASARAYAHVEALAREIANARMKIRPNCAARTHENDIRPIAYPGGRGNFRDLWTDLPPVGAASCCGVFMFDRRTGMVDTDKPATKWALAGAAE